MALHALPVLAASGQFVAGFCMQTHALQQDGYTTQTPTHTSPYQVVLSCDLLFLQHVSTQRFGCAVRHLHARTHAHTLAHTYVCVWRRRCCTGMSATNQFQPQHVCC